MRRAAFVVAVIGAQVALVANLAEGSWLRAVVWAIASTGLVLMWIGGRGRRVPAEPVARP